MKLAILLVSFAVLGQAQDFDVLIQGGRIVDGTGNPSYVGDLGIRHGKIIAMGHLAGKTATRAIDATGLTVAPGFIDIHNHSDYTVVEDPDAESMVRQGVTSMILGEGGSAAPAGGKQDREDDRWDWTNFNGYFARLLRQGISTNIGSYIEPNLDVRARAQGWPAHTGGTGSDARIGEAGDGTGRARRGQFPERPSRLVD